MVCLEVEIGVFAIPGDDSGNRMWMDAELTGNPLVCAAFGFPGDNASLSGRCDRNSHDEECGI